MSIDYLQVLEKTKVRCSITVFVCLFVYVVFRPDILKEAMSWKTQHCALEEYYDSIMAYYGSIMALGEYYGVLWQYYGSIMALVELYGSLFYETRLDNPLAVNPPHANSPPPLCQTPTVQLYISNTCEPILHLKNVQGSLANDRPFITILYLKYILYLK